MSAIQQILLGKTMWPKFQVDTNWTLTTSLQAYYKMEDNKDIWNGNNATDTWITYAAGKVNNGSVYNGSSKFSTYAQAIETSDFTVAAWYNTSSSAGNPVIFSNNNWLKYTDCAYISTWWYFSIFANFISATVTLDSNWHLMICSRNWANMYLYIDNVLLASGWVTDNAGSSTMVFWWRPFDSASLLTGKIDEAGIWTKALSSQERTDLWNSGNWQTMS